MKSANAACLQGTKPLHGSNLSGTETQTQVTQPVKRFNTFQDCGFTGQEHKMGNTTPNRNSRGLEQRVCLVVLQWRPARPLPCPNLIWLCTVQGLQPSDLVLSCLPVSSFLLDCVELFSGWRRPTLSWPRQPCPTLQSPPTLTLGDYLPLHHKLHAV